MSNAPRDKMGPKPAGRQVPQFTVGEKRIVRKQYRRRQGFHIRTVLTRTQTIWKPTQKLRPCAFPQIGRIPGTSKHLAYS